MSTDEDDWDVPKWRRSKLEFTKEGGDFEKSSKEIVDGIGMLQKRRGGRSGERGRSDIAKKVRAGSSCGMGYDRQ
jgi:hypothetical protein